VGAEAGNGPLPGALSSTARQQRSPPHPKTSTQRTKRLPFNGEIFEAAHGPIIDEERFNQAQELLATRAESHPDRRRNSTGYLLSSLMKCAKCGHGFNGTRTAGAEPIATTHASPGSGTGPLAAIRIGHPPTRWRTRSSA
jgi:hypothetical protein